MNGRVVDTRRGTRVRVLEAGPDETSQAGSEPAAPIVFLHGLSGLLEDTTCLDVLAQQRRVLAPELPGYGASQGELLLEDMLDFALHGWDVVTALDVSRPVLVGHSLGGMIAAEMACLAPQAVAALVLVDPFGLWMDDQPIPDIYSFLPYEFGDYLFHDPARARHLLAGATDVADPEQLRDFFIGNARRLGTAGKMLFPIPNRRLSKRLYRLSTPTLVVWGDEDRLIPVSYAECWQSHIPHARLARVPRAGHMLPYEQPLALAAEIASFLASTSGG